MHIRIKSSCDLAWPSLDKNVAIKQDVQGQNFRGAKSKEFRLLPCYSYEAGDHVYRKHYSRTGAAYTPGTVEARSGPVSCRLCGEGGHFDQQYKQVTPADTMRNPGLVINWRAYSKLLVPNA